LQYIQDSGCIEYAKVVQTLCVQKADEIFGTIEALSPWKEKLREITYDAFT
jgi:competence protein ComQ